MFASEGPPVSSAGLEKGSGRKQERGHSERSQAPVAVKAAPAGAAGGTEAVLQAGREWNTGETVLLEIPSSSKRVPLSISLCVQVGVGPAKGRVEQRSSRGPWPYSANLWRPRRPRWTTRSPPPWSAGPPPFGDPLGERWGSVVEGPGARQRCPLAGKRGCGLLSQTRILGLRRFESRIPQTYS